MVYWNQNNVSDMKHVRMRIREEKQQFVGWVTWPTPREAKSWTDKQAKNLMAQSTHELFSRRTKPNQPHNTKYENTSALQESRSGKRLKKELHVPDHVFMLNISASTNCDYTFTILNIIFLVNGNEKDLTVCLEGGCALVYSGLVATDSCKHPATVLSYKPFWDRHLGKKWHPEFFNWGYCLEKN